MKRVGIGVVQIINYNVCQNEIRETKMVRMKLGSYKEEDGTFN